MMPIVLGLLIALHICWPVWRKQLASRSLCASDYVLALTIGTLELGLMAMQYHSIPAATTYLFAGIPAATYLLATSLDMFSAES